MNLLYDFKDYIYIQEKLAAFHFSYVDQLKKRGGCPGKILPLSFSLGTKIKGCKTENSNPNNKDKKS